MNYMYLTHHGVKGQRWGVRRTPAQLGHKVNKKKKAKAAEAEKKKEMTLEEKKSAVLDSRSAKSLYENRKLFNYDEMNRAHKLLELDKKVKDMIVHEPNKVEKFVDDKLIPWAKRIKDFTEPVAATLKKMDEISKLLNDDDDQNGSSKDTNNKNKTKTDKTKADDTKTDKTKTDKSKTEDTKTVKTDKTKTDSDRFYEADWTDITPSRETRSVVASIGSTSVAALPPSAQAPTYIAGLLEPPKE